MQHRMQILIIILAHTYLKSAEVVLFCTFPALSYYQESLDCPHTRTAKITIREIVFRYTTIRYYSYVFCFKGRCVGEVLVHQARPSLNLQKSDSSLID